jgi:hypothetical protein
VTRLKIEVLSPGDDLEVPDAQTIRDAILSSARAGTLGTVRVTLERFDLPREAGSAGD